MTRKALALLGICICAAGALGFFTYADDFRHTGELVAASGLVLAGIGLLTSAFQSTLPFHWLPIAALIGLLVGFALDAAVFGFTGGIAIGLLATWWRHRAQG